MTPKTLYLTKIGQDKYVVDEDGGFLMLIVQNNIFYLKQVENNLFGLDLDENLQIENIQRVQATDDLVTFAFGGYKFEWDSEEGAYISSEVPPDFAGTGELVSHNFGVDEAFLCDKLNNVVWATLGGQKVYFEQSAIGQFSTASTKPQTAAEMGAPAFEASQNTSFMLAGYVFINEEANSYASSPVPPTR